MRSRYWHKLPRSGEQGARRAVGTAEKRVNCVSSCQTSDSNKSRSVNMEDTQPSALPAAEAQPGHRQRFSKHPKSGLLEMLSPGNPQASWMLEQAHPLHRGDAA